MFYMYMSMNYYMNDDEDSFNYQYESYEFDMLYYYAIHHLSTITMFRSSRFQFSITDAMTNEQ